MILILRNIYIALNIVNFVCKDLTIIYLNLTLFNYNFA